jgi:DNA-binding GntR family transcriptional regulator
MVADRLRAAIVAGTFAPGARMRQEDLAARLAVSRAPVREALVMLEREGLVVIDRWRGAVVAPLDLPLIRDLYEFRETIERYVAETLATRKTLDTAPVREIVRLGTLAAAKGDLERLIDLDLRFHRRLYEAVGNTVLVNVMSGHWIHTQRVMAATLRERGYPKTAWDEHAAILDAIAAGDRALAGRRAAGHMAAAASRMIETFTAEPADKPVVRKAARLPLKR